MQIGFENSSIIVEFIAFYITYTKKLIALYRKIEFSCIDDEPCELWKLWISWIKPKADYAFYFDR